METIPTKTVHDPETGLWATGNATLGVWAQGASRADAEARFPRLLTAFLAACDRQGLRAKVLGRLPS
jgi:hypothetical protein